MKISYLVTCSSETDTLDRLLKCLINSINNNDEIVILKDSSVENEKTETIIRKYNVPVLKWYNHPLKKNYGAHKNFGIQQCEGEFLFQLDGDEFPPESLLGDNIHELIDANPIIEAYAVPRINDFQGVTETHAKTWGWKLTISPTYNRPIVNWPDYQFRIFKRDFPRISFLRRLHEKIEGYMNYVRLPDSEEYAIYHDKTIETQIKTNVRYNAWFTPEENRGHSVFNNEPPPFKIGEKRYVATIIRTFGNTLTISKLKNEGDIKPKIGDKISFADPKNDEDFDIVVTNFIEEKELEWIFEGEKIICKNQ